MEFLPISFETILNILNKNKNKLNFDDIFFQIKNNPKYKIEAIELYPILHSLLKDGYINKYNSKNSVFNSHFIEPDDILYITTKGKLYLTNVTFTKEHIDREKKHVQLAEEANLIAKKAKKEAKFANYVAIFSLLIAIIALFKK
jgi:DNA-binding PadR family transcriptional regulator